MPFKIKNATPYEFGMCHGYINPPQPSLTLIVKGTFKIVPNGVATVHDEQHSLTGDVFGGDGSDPMAEVLTPSDMAPFKPNADVLVEGICYAPRGEEVEITRVGLELGDINKQLDVVGDRVWKPNRIGGLSTSDPIPFKEMPLDFTRSFGGGTDDDKYPFNTAGTGYIKGDMTGVALPNVELPHDRIASLTSKPMPANFGPIGLMWKPRVSKLGTYGGDYTQNRFPFFAADFDWSFYNAAPEDQQMEFLRGDESVVLTNLHPEHPKLTASLPSTKVRMFVVIDRGEEEAAIEEVSTVLDSLHLIPHENKMVLTWRGALEVSDATLPELLEIWAVEQPWDKSKSPEQCAEAAAAVGDEEPDEDGELPEDEGENQDTLEKKKDLPGLKIPGMGAAVGGLGIGLVGAPKDTDQPDEKNEAEQEGQEEKKDADSDKNEDADPDSPGPVSRQQVIDAHAQKQSLKGALLTEMDLAGLNLSSIDLTEASLINVSLEGADLTGAILDQTVFEQCDLCSASMQAASMNEASITSCKLTEADFSGVNARKAMFYQCEMNKVNFSKAGLDGASFYESPLMEACFENATMAETEILQCDISRALFAGAALSNASFNKVKAIEIDFTDTNIEGLRANAENVFDQCNLAGASGADSLWDGAVIKNCDLSGAQMAGSSWNQANLVGVDMSGADFKGASFMRCQITQANMSNSNFFEGRFDHAVIKNSDIRRSNLFGACLMFATIDVCDLSDSNVQRTVLVM